MRRARPGFTLVELLLYLGIAAVLMGGVAAFSVAVFEAKIKHQVIAEVEEQGDFALQRIMQITRNATAVSAPAVQTSGTGLTVTVKDVSKSPTVFSVSGGQLRLQEGALEAVPLTTTKVSVSNLTVKNLTTAGSHGSVEIQFTLAYLNSSGRAEYSYSRQFTGSATLRGGQ